MKHKSDLDTPLTDSRLYFGEVMHARLKPFRHKFKYRVFSMLIDIDRIETLAAKTRLFSYNKTNIFSFFDKDHGPRNGEALRPWIDHLLDGADVDLEDGRVHLLCYPRLFGYVFNPLSVYYCYDRSDELKAIVYEVSNTFGESHAYVAPIEPSSDKDTMIGQQADKVFYVSPFLEVAGDYKFRLNRPDDDLSVAIRQTQDQGPTLVATFQGRAKPFTDGTLLKAFFSYPLMTFKIIGAIHWEALHLWRKGAKYVTPPDGPNHGTSFSPPSSP